jgi:hypothetical protein
MSTGKNLCIHSSVLSECNNDNPENDLRSAILDLTLALARSGEHGEVDFPTSHTVYIKFYPTVAKSQ